MRNLRAAGVARDGNDLHFLVRLQIVGDVGADAREREIIFRAEIAVGILQTEAERRGTVPVHEQQIVAPITVHVEDLHGFDAAGEGNFLRFAQLVVSVLREEINEIFREQQQVGAAIAVEVAGDERVGREQAVVNRPALRRAPTVRALVILHDEFFGISVVAEIGATVAVEIGDDKRGDALLGRDGLDAETGVGREFIEVALGGNFFDNGRVGFAGAVVEKVDFGAGIVDDHEVVEAIAINIGGVELADVGVERENFRAAEAEAVGVGGVGGQQRDGESKRE